MDTIEFVLRFALGIPAVAVWLWAFATGLAIFFLIGIFGGRLWNNSWSLNLGMGTLVAFFALLGAFSVFNLRSISSTENWLTEQRTEVSEISGPRTKQIRSYESEVQKEIHAGI